MSAAQPEGRPGPLLYEVRCWSDRDGAPHGLTLASVYLVDSRPHWQFTPGAWAAASDGDDPQIYVRCARHGIGAVPALNPAPSATARSKPRVVRVVCS